MARRLRSITIPRRAPSLPRRPRAHNLRRALFARAALETGFIFLVALAASLVVARHIAVRDAIPRVVLLGSGDQVSALIVDGDARMLIANGTDGEAFRNAFSSSLFFTDRRIDVLVITGARADLPVAAAARSSIHAKRILVLDGPLTTSLDDLNLDSSAIIPGGTSVALGRTTKVAFEIAATGEGSSAIQGWQAMIERNGVRIRLVSDAKLLGSFTDRRPVSALVLAAAPEPGPLAARFSSLSLPAGAIDPSQLLPVRHGAIPVAKVRNGGTLSMAFEDDGLRLAARFRPVQPASPQAGGLPLAAILEENSA